MFKLKHKLIVGLVAALSAQLLLPTLIHTASAIPPTFGESFLRLDRLKALTFTTGTVCAKPQATDPGVGSEAHVRVTFPTQGSGTDFVVSSVLANWTTNTTNLPKDPDTGTAATAWPGVGTATDVTGKAVTFPSTALTAGTFYCFNWTNSTALKTSSNNVGGNALRGFITTLDGAGTPNVLTQTQYAVNVITNDQIAVSAVVPPNFTITFSRNTDVFETDLSPTATTITSASINSPVEVTITTNAPNGWVTWIKDNDAVHNGLYSSLANYTIPTARAAGVAASVRYDNAVGTEQYGAIGNVLTDAAGGCVVGIDGMYAFNGAGAGAGTFAAPTYAGTIDTVYQTFAACSSATKPATSDGDHIQIREVANIRGGTPAGADYANTIDFVGAGNF